MLNKISAAIASVLLLLIGIPMTAAASTPIYETSGYVALEGNRGRFQPCASEDSVSCVWHAPTRGNGRGMSFVTDDQGNIHYVSHWRADYLSAPVINDFPEATLFEACQDHMFAATSDGLIRIAGEYPNVASGAYYKHGNDLYWYSDLEEC